MHKKEGGGAFLQSVTRQFETKFTVAILLYSREGVRKKVRKKYIRRRPLKSLPPSLTFRSVFSCENGFSTAGRKKSG